MLVEYALLAYQVARRVDHLRTVHHATRVWWQTPTVHALKTSLLIVLTAITQILWGHVLSAIPLVKPATVALFLVAFPVLVDLQYLRQEHVCLTARQVISIIQIHLPVNFAHLAIQTVSDVMKQAV